MALERGVVKFFNDEKGYGFLITGEDEELFFHRRNGREVTQAADGALSLSYEPLPKGTCPKTYRTVLFERGRDAKGPVAERWGFDPNPKPCIKINWKGQGGHKYWPKVARPGST
ncbi:hypothetical protein A3E65_00020 [Candidatus Kaiserbacteria bacterium RIFCSPHIGHO2_12_FULL_56_13]|uniref:CSD domain-containing protein n=2 Tax=Candidatus Kaiseribacteriota TaxID=1752734 RepID=A0A1F6E3I5_9BACT|nr:MAG: hypothetical protein A3C95_02235 [Candidatus Kaiserbacteria bacterium RIFCSPHIGHO2_02_FULL_56_30]OGG72193.1 MAG: hypothetical protein A3E65_00020 [Candidatus Kaiserbacteria bacterium RIFCSPHIGHO2_12_FULL_56_13]